MVKPEDTYVWVVLSRLDGMIIDYSFDTSTQKRDELMNKHTINPKDDDEWASWFKIVTLKQLLSHNLKSRTNNFNDQ